MNLRWISMTKVKDDALKIIVLTTEEDPQILGQPVTYEMIKDLHDTFLDNMVIASELNRDIRELYQLCKADGTWGLTNNTGEFITGGCKTVQLKMSGDKVVKGYKIKQSDGTYPDTFVDNWFSEDYQNDTCEEKQLTSGTSDCPLYNKNNYNTQQTLTKNCEVKYDCAGQYDVSINGSPINQ